MPRSDRAPERCADEHVEPEVNAEVDAREGDQRPRRPASGRRRRGASTAIAAATANALIAWPEGNDGEPGTPTTASRPIASGGRLRSTSAFSTRVEPRREGEAQRGRAARRAAAGDAGARSEHQPTATSSGPLTHQAETSARTAVAGLQRSAVVARTASWSRPTSSCSVFPMAQVAPCGGRDAHQGTPAFSGRPSGGCWRSRRRRTPGCPPPSSPPSPCGPSRCAPATRDRRAPATPTGPTASSG